MHNTITEQISDLRRMKRLATGLLAFFTLIFVISSIYVEQAVWIGFVQAIAEAAMVGAIADWFAVTALFRHPLGLKIPHTAIVPTRKDSIGLMLGQFVRENFLTDEVIAGKLRSMNASRQLADWLAQPENSELLAKYGAAGVAAVVEVMKDEDIQDLIQANLTSQIQSIKIAPLLGTVLAVVASGTRQRELVRGLINLTGSLIEDNKLALKAKIAEETPWWLPKNVDDVIFEKVIDASDRTLREIRRDPHHPIHNKFNEVIGRFIEDLKTSPEILAREESFKADLLDDPLVREFSASLWVDLKAVLLNINTDQGTTARQPIQEGLVRFAKAVRDDEAMIQKLDGWIETAAVYVAREYGDEVEHLIAQTISRWDPEETANKIELQVGKDLQFIRINGTLVGGLIGFVIHALSLLL
ncbi:MAG: DUF445 domain-containing protein [Anaerolineae bacterium]|nr:DUF445 domain-containing protein [Anaerolineae bacterium]